LYGGGEVDVDDLLLVELAAGELVAEGDFDGELGVLRGGLPGAGQDVGADEDGAEPGFAGGLGVEGPLANLGFLQEEVEGFDGEGAGGLEGLAFVVGGGGVDLEGLVAGLGAVEVGAAGEAAELEAVGGEKGFELGGGEGGDGGRVAGFEGSNRGGVGIAGALEGGDLVREGMVLHADGDGGGVVGAAADHHRRGAAAGLGTTRRRRSVNRREALPARARRGSGSTRRLA
jgi:hypothetical protein